MWRKFRAAMLQWSANQRPGRRPHTPCFSQRPPGRLPKASMRTLPKFLTSPPPSPRDLVCRKIQSGGLRLATTRVNSCNCNRRLNPSSHSNIQNLSRRSHSGDGSTIINRQSPPPDVGSSPSLHSRTFHSKFLCLFVGTEPLDESDDPIYEREGFLKLPIKPEMQEAKAMYSKNASTGTRNKTSARISRSALL